MNNNLIPVRCHCNRLLGKFGGEAEVKCMKCKSVLYIRIINDHVEISILRNDKKEKN